MKKSLLFALSLLIAASASALDLKPAKSALKVKDIPQKQLLQQSTQKKHKAKAPMAKAPTAEGFELGFCGDIYSWYYAAQQNKVTYQMLKIMDEPIANALAGNKITEITFSAALTSATQTRKGEIFVAEISDEGQLEIVTSQEVDVIDSYESSETGDQTAAFENPYVIKEDTPFCFGVSIKGCSYMALGNNVKADYPIGVDGESANPFAGLVFLYDSTGNYMGGIDMGEDVGTNLYLKALTVGDKNSLDNVFVIQGAMLDPYAFPIIVGNRDKTATVGIGNMGTNTLTSVKYTASVADGETLTQTCVIDIAPGTNDLLDLPLPSLGIGNKTLTLTIDEINGVPADFVAELPFLSMDNEGYSRKFVVEEATGTWCGYCPMGIAGFEFMEENHPDTFLGIAVHGDDAMETPSYKPWLDKWIDGFPQAVVNRDAYWSSVYPDPEELEWTYNIWKDQRTPAIVDVEAAYDAEAQTINATVNTEFAIDYEDVSIQLVLLQNDIPDIQTNYFAGGKDDYYGWESKEEKVGWMYKHVARDLFDVDNALPATITKGTKYTSTFAIPTTNVTELANVTGIDKTSVIALVIDNKTGVILNAAQVKADKYSESGIKDMLNTICDVRTANGTIMINGNYNNAAVYSISGAQAATINGGIAKVPAGIYLVRVDGKSFKVIVK